MGSNNSWSERTTTSLYSDVVPVTWGEWDSKSEGIPLKSLLKVEHADESLTSGEHCLLAVAT